MEPPHARAARLTVLVSCRMDEMLNLREAAIRAIYDAQAKPLFFEGSAPVLPADAPRVPKQLRDEQKLELEAWSDRITIDRILDRSELFIGIYAVSLGKAQPKLCGLAPIHYEFTRFLVRLHLEHRHGRGSPETERELDRCFPHAEFDTPPDALICHLNAINSAMGGCTRTHLSAAYSVLIGQRVRMFRHVLDGRPAQADLNAFLGRIDASLLSTDSISGSAGVLPAFRSSTTQIYRLTSPRTSEDRRRKSSHVTGTRRGPPHPAAW